MAALDVAYAGPMGWLMKGPVKTSVAETLKVATDCSTRSFSVRSRDEDRSPQFVFLCGRHHRRATEVGGYVKVFDTRCINGEDVAMPPAI